VEIERLRNEKHMVEQYLSQANDKIEKLERTVEYHDQKIEEDLIKRMPKSSLEYNDSKTADEDALTEQLARLTRNITQTNAEMQLNFSRLNDISTEELPE